MVTRKKVRQDEHRPGAHTCIIKILFLYMF